VRVNLACIGERRQQLVPLSMTALNFNKGNGELPYTEASIKSPPPPTTPHQPIEEDHLYLSILLSSLLVFLLFGLEEANLILIYFWTLLLVKTVF
jgi:hypothetical protein